MRRIQKVMKVIKKQKGQRLPKTHIERCEAVWSAIRKRKTFDVGSITQTTGCTAGFVHRYVNRLTLAGYLSVKQQIPANVYTLIKDAGVRAPLLNAEGVARPVTGYQRIWSAIPVMKSFTAKDIALAADVTWTHARRYLNVLHGAGYLRVISLPSDRMSLPVYSLLPGRHSGPKAPRCIGEAAVYDENLRRVVGGLEDV